MGVEAMRFPGQSRVSLSRVGSIAAIIILGLSANVHQVEAQSGHIVGVVQDDEGRPLQFARVFVVGTELSAESGADGSVRIRNVPTGEQQLRTSLIGYRPATVASIVVSRDAETQFVVRLERIPMQLGAIVASVSRRAEEITRAPAAVTAFSHRVVADALGSWWTEVLKGTPAITLTQVGVMSSVLNGRGFNKTFSTRWLTVEDGRVAMLPETGVAVGDHSTISKIDVAAAEVIAGAGAALYGANAASGILSVRTKDPREYPGTTLEVSTGTRDYIDTQLRHAGTFGPWGYKVTAELQRAREWDDAVYYAAPGGGAALREADHDPDPRVLRGSASIRYYFPDGAHIALNAGASARNGLVQTGQGRQVLDDYSYQLMQLEFSSARWFLQAYTSHSNAGGTYQLQVLTPTLAANPTLPYDSARTIAGFPVDGRLMVGEVRYADFVGLHVHSGISAIDNTRFTLGGQLRRDRAFSNGRIYTDVFTGQPVIVDQKSVYFQVESPLTKELRLHGAARYDQSNRMRGRWSPSIALLHDLGSRQSVRLSYNQAFVPATMTNTDFYGLNRAARVLVRGNADGFVVKDSAGNLVKTVAPVRPETNRTWEIGYRGILRDRLFADVSLFRMHFEGFISPALIIANPLEAPRTYAFNARTGEAFADASGAPLQVRTVYNMGNATVVGFDLGVRYYLADQLSLAYGINLSTVTRSTVAPGDPPEVTAFNTSPTRMNLSIERHNLAKADVTLSSRYVHGYPFQAAANRGRVPTFATLSAGMRWPIDESTTVLLHADNIVSCVAGRSIPPALGITSLASAGYMPGRSCGFNKRHMETPNMPSIGTMLIIGVRREWR